MCYKPNRDFKNRLCGSPVIYFHTLYELPNYNLWHEPKYPFLRAQVVNDLKSYPNFKPLFPCQVIRASQLQASLNPETIFQMESKVKSSTITAAAPVVNDVCSLTNKQCTAMFIGLLNSFDNVAQLPAVADTFILGF